ncbi:MAG: DNA-3-methyladenine glycosylase I [Chitinophagales bacterium]
MATTYCEVVEKMEPVNVHKIYHDTEYGFPIYDDDALFGRLILEINQAGLSWTTILKKKENFHMAFHGFQINKVAAYKERDINRLLNDAGIIRNRLKVAAVIENAKRLRVIQKEFGSFKDWLNHYHPKTKEEWVKIFKLTFKFTGGEIVNEFLVSIGYLPGAHTESCPVYKKVLKQKPAWKRK